ncbi:MAG: MBL fold metallo-hydrolase [Dehalococcoidia bacterium]|nr:MBL fold metallo-hydrolase [Dehalococcoidia bacterium]
MEIAPGVHNIEGVTGSNVVLLADEQMVVVDTGLPGNGDTIVAYIKKIGRSASDLRWILLTHFHFDHSGSAAELHDLTGAQIVTHKAETQPGPDGNLLLRKGDEGEAPPRWYRWAQRFADGNGGRRRPQAVRQFPDTPVHETMDDGDVIPCLEGLRIIHSPGHTPGSISPLLTGPEVLFLGDSVLNNVDRLSRPLMWDRSKRRQLDASLHALRDLEADLACFGHGPPLTEDVMDKVRGLTDRPYDLPTWRIALKNWSTLRRWRSNTRRPGRWQGGGP